MVLTYVLSYAIRIYLPHIFVDFDSRIVRNNTSLAASADQPSESKKKTKKRKKRKREAGSDYSGEEAAVNSQTASLLRSGGWDLLKWIDQIQYTNQEVVRIFYEIL